MPSVTSVRSAAPAGIASRAALVAGFAVALALAAQVSIPLPGTPVPLTLQPFVVVLAGLWLGPVAGAAAMLAYLAAGAAGLPVFSPMGAPGVLRLLGPTGGYLLAYPAAAFVAGFVARRLPSLGGRTLGALAGMLAIYAGGLAQLVALTGSATQAALLGAAPFALMDAAKAVVAGLVAPRPRADR